MHLWFTALDHRQAEILTGMCHEEVVIRPFRASQVAGAEFVGHAGVRDWVGSLDDRARIVLDLINVEITGGQSAVVEADVWLDTDGERSGGATFSVWRFEDGLLREAVGYGTREDALAAEANV